MAQTERPQEDALKTWARILADLVSRKTRRP